MSQWDAQQAGLRFDSAAWAKVRDDEEDRLWDRFDAMFRFRPSMYSLPGIDEPTPSITYNLLYEDGSPAEPVWVNRAVLSALRRITNTGDSIVVMDWQHESYRCRPHRVRGDQAPDQMWPIEVYPDGDYHLWLTEDFRNGTFGHPWEPSLCVFGEDLLAAVAESGDEALGRVLRRNGRTPCATDTSAEQTDA